MCYLEDLAVLQATEAMLEESSSIPEWLPYLERPKVKKLAHEFGAGAPCSNCDFCPGLELHFWRKKCILCECKLEDHLVDGNDYPQYHILFGLKKVEKSVADFEGKLTFFDWVPQTKDPLLVGQYMSTLPEKWRPVTGSLGSQYRRKQLEKQLPRYDVDPFSCSALSSDEANAHAKYKATLKESAAGMGTLHKLNEFDNDGVFRAEPIWFIDAATVEDVQHCADKAELISGNSFTPEQQIPSHCQECQAALLRDDLVIRAARVGNALWHPQCFLCATCNELLVDLHYFHGNDQIYCGRHYAEAVSKRRCFACDELIFEKEYACANGRFFHNRHFCCSVCDKCLGGKQFIEKNGNMLCPPCYQKEFDKTCEKCKKPVSPFEQRVQLGQKVYHKDPNCFVCSSCNVTLQGKHTYIHKNVLLCGKHASNNQP